MRTIVRDRQDIYVALQLPPITLVDGNGYECGEVIQFDVPQKFTVRVSDLTEEGEIALYGTHATSMKKIVESLVVLPPASVDYMAAVWIGLEPPTRAYDDPIETETTTVIPEPLDFNYRVSRGIQTTPRQIVVYLESVIPNGS